MKGLFLVLLCFVCFGCGGGGGAGRSSLTFTGDWVGTWDLSPSENGPVSMQFEPLNSNDEHQFDADLTATPIPANGTLDGAIDADGILAGGVYQLQGSTFTLTGGSVALSQDKQTIIGSFIIQGGGQLELNLTRQ